MNNVFGGPTEMDRLNEVTRRRIERGERNPHRIITPYDDGYNDVPFRPPQWFNNLTNTVRGLYEVPDPPALIIPGPPRHPRLQQPPNNNNKQMPEPIKATEGDLACIICMENIADHCIIPCGHISLCALCSNKLTHQDDVPTCPVCRGQITDIIQTFSVGVPYHVGGRKSKRSRKSKRTKKSRKSKRTKKSRKSKK